MKKINLIIASAALLGLLALPMTAEAQNRQQGGGAGGGQRQGGGGFGQQRGGMGMMSVTKSMLLGRNDVQKDLKITAEQKAALEKAQADQRAKMQARMEELRNGGGGGGGDFTAIREEFEKMAKEADDAAMKVLTKEQQTRLGQIQIQFDGMRVILKPEIQKELGMKADQKKRLDELQEQQQAANMAIMQRVRDGEISREEVGPLMEQNNKALDAEFEKVLTDDQKAKLKEMQGAKFTRDPKDDEAMRNFGRGGRGGGGGN